MIKIIHLDSNSGASLTLVGYTNNACLTKAFKSADEFIVRFVKVTVYAVIYNTSLQSCNNAIHLALNNSNIVSVNNNTINSNDAEITSTYAAYKNFFNKSGQDDFSISLVKGTHYTI
ncbi:DUF3568 family protein, partial [Francisella tularensis]|uniref:DUF3568 family protein n=1 Tax=Francisella tularensis TaxID=263 RepID=UPI00174C0BC2